MVLADHVLRRQFLALRPREQERERRSKDVLETRHAKRLYSLGARESPKATLRRGSSSASWMDATTPGARSGSSSGSSAAPVRCGRSGGASTSTCAPRPSRTGGLRLRRATSSTTPRGREPDPRGRLVVSEHDGLDDKVKPFRREELLEPLERLFFGRVAGPRSAQVPVLIRSDTARIPTTRSCSGRSSGARRHARARARAGRVRHPDAERVGDRGPARGQRDLARRVSARRRPLRCCCPTVRRWATATGRSSSRASRSSSAVLARSRS